MRAGVQASGVEDSGDDVASFIGLDVRRASFCPERRKQVEVAYSSLDLILNPRSFRFRGRRIVASRVRHSGNGTGACRSRVPQSAGAAPVVRLRNR